MKDAADSYMVPLMLELNLQSEVKTEAVKLAERRDPVIRAAFLQYLHNRDHLTF